MISPRVILFATLTLAAMDNAQASLDLPRPVNFYFKDGDILDINIFLHCVPENASTFALYYETENCHVHPDNCTGLAKYGSIPENKTMTITQPLGRLSVTIYIVLYNQSKEAIDKTVIMKGSRDEYAHINAFREICLNKQNQHTSKCQITVYFGNQCEERAVKIDCTQNELLMCEVGDEKLPEDMVHQWYQEYENGSYIVPIPQLKGKRTEFKMTLQKFDNNTNIYTIMNSTRSQRILYSQTFKVSLPKDGFKDYDIQDTIQYAENDIINFFCSNHTNTQIGWIDPTGDKIILHNETYFHRRFSKKGNYGMFCCISYSIYNISNKIVLERFVYNITLIKMKPAKQKNIKDGTSTPLPVPPPVPKTTKTSHSQPSAHLSTSAEQGNTDPLSLAWIITAGAAGTILLVAIIYIVNKRWCRKSSDPDQTLQLETYGSTNRVLYAELDIRREPTQPPPAVDDPTYAQIIGVLSPDSAGVAGPRDYRDPGT